MESTDNKPVSRRAKSSHGLKRFYRKSGASILTAIVVVLGALVAVYFLLPQGERINNNGYQVVYMTTGQAYFGKLKNTGGSYLVLDTPYTAQDVKPEGEESIQTSTTLVKVSQQQYGPEEAMSLKSDQVLFWQNLRDDSKVAQAINNAN